MKKVGTPLIGMAIGFALVIWSITSSGPIGAFLDVSSVVIVLFGSLAALVISFPVGELTDTPQILRDLIFSPEEDRVEIVQQFIELSKKARQSGLLAIENDLETIENDMMVHSIQMVVDGKDGESIESVLDLQMDEIEERYAIGPNLFYKWAEYAPAFGMIGTLVGLIIMLGELDDPSTIGSGMATALLTTFYGSLFANLIFNPIASNLERLAEDKMVTNEVIVAGTLAIQSGQNPRDIEQQLKSFLTPTEIKRMNEMDPELEMNLGKQEV